MTPGWLRLLLPALVLAWLAGPVLGVTLDEGDRPTAADPDFAAGAAAFEREDWAEVVEHMSKVIERRPWHDEAHNRLGFAQRKLGNYEEALTHYHRALQLNPHNRGALEYLGEALLELGRADQAHDVLELLAIECRRISGADGEAWQDECEEWQDLVAAFEADGAAGRPSEGVEPWTGQQ